MKPGAIADGGAALLEAHAELLRRLHAYLIDVASEAATFEVFKAEVERFFGETDADTEREWNDAVQAVRAGKVHLADLDKVPLEKRKFRIRVTLIQELSPDENPAEDRIAVAA